MYFCTLFDRNYLERALILIESLENVCDSFCLFAIMMDDEAYNIMSSLCYKEVILIREEDIRDADMDRVRKERGRSEYCWTCTAASLLYVLETYDIPSCTYIDADMVFYQNPAVLEEEIINSECSISVIEHRFPKNIMESEQLEKSGRYCVEYNTFMNDPSGISALKWWKKQCIDSCSAVANGKSFGDQKYIEEMMNKFSPVHIISNLGAGVAPWNLPDYRMIDEKNGMIILRYVDNTTCPLVFYHFQYLRVLDDNTINTGAYLHMWFHQKRLVDRLYIEYVHKLIEKRKMLNNRFGLVVEPYEERGTANKITFSNLRDRVKHYVKYIYNIVNERKNIIHL